MEGLWIAVVDVQVLLDGLLELARRAMGSSANVLLGKAGKPALQLIEPGRRSRCVVRVEPRVAREPVANCWRLVRAVVVHHKVYLQCAGCVGSQGAQELQELAAAVAAVSRAMVRVLQCVAPCGIDSNMRAITALTRASSMLRGAPGRGASSRPSMQWSTKRARHLETVRCVTSWRTATTLFSMPSAQPNTIDQRISNSGH